MGKLYEKLMQDYRFKEGMKACINCGTCTAICPAAEFYKYDPRSIVDMVQSRDEEAIEKLLKSETIWYCGECMSCVTRCPRKNAPGLIVMALRSLSIDEGYFIHSEKGRQQYVINKEMYSNILNYGYCVYPRTFKYEDHPEHGTTGQWIEQNLDEIHKRVGSNLDGDGPGILRKIPDEDLMQLRNIFEQTGAFKRMDTLKRLSKERADSLGLTEEEYSEQIFNTISEGHFN